MQNPDYYLIVDLEATCCDDDSIRRREMEIIEIGAVLVNSQTLEFVDEFETFIKPVRHRELTKFCTQLTSITQVDVNAAPDFAEAITRFKRWLYKYQNFLFCSWGDYDYNQLHQDCQFHGVPFPIAGEHCNIKVAFTEKQNLKKRYGMADALALAKIPLVGTHHRGIDDARNMAKLMPYIFGSRKVSRA